MSGVALASCTEVKPLRTHSPAARRMARFAWARVIGVFVDAGEFQSALIGPRSKCVQANEKHGMIRRGRAQGLLSRVMRSPFAFIPAPAENPFAGRGQGGPLFDALDDFFFRGNVLEIQPDKTFTEIN